MANISPYTKRPYLCLTIIIWFSLRHTRRIITSVTPAFTLLKLSLTQYVAIQETIKIMLHRETWARRSYGNSRLNFGENSHPTSENSFSHPYPQSVHFLESRHILNSERIIRTNQYLEYCQTVLFVSVIVYVQCTSYTCKLIGRPCKSEL